jgi:hypothetical protein
MGQSIGEVFILQVKIQRQLLRIGNKQGMKTFHNVLQLSKPPGGLVKRFENTLFMTVLHIYATF